MSSSSKPSSPPVPSPQDIHAALSAIGDLEGIANKKGHKGVALLSRVLRLRILVAASMWADVPEALKVAEQALGLSYQPSTTPKPRKPGQQEEFISFEDSFEAAMAVHLLMMSVVFFTHVGNAEEASPRLSHLHALMDSGALEKFPDGIVEVGADMVSVKLFWAHICMSQLLFATNFVMHVLTFWLHRSLCRSPLRSSSKSHIHAFSSSSPFSLARRPSAMQSVGDLSGKSSHKQV